MDYDGEKTTSAAADGFLSAQPIIQPNQDYYAPILEIATDAIISINQEQQIIFFNKGAEKIFGYQADDVINRPLDILLPPHLTASHQGHVRDFGSAPETARSMGARREILGRRQNGETFPAEASISKASLNGERVFTVVLRDITERQRIEREREQLINQLKALDEATQAINSRTSLEQVLRTIIQAAQSLIKTTYAALGIHDGRGHLARFITVGLSDEEQSRIGALPLGRGLLGLLLREGQALMISDLNQHPAAAGFPHHHPPMSKLLGVPIFSKGELLGAFYLTDKIDGSDFTATDQHLLTMLARHAAVAIENARLDEQHQQLAIADERTRFARDLHDSIIQSIYGVGLLLDQIKVLAPVENEAAQKMIDLSLKSLAGVIDDLRNYIFDLRPQALGQRDLETRLAGLIKEVKMNTHLPLEVELSPNLNTILTEMQARHLFHIAHEALANIVRHAKASRIRFSLLHQAGTVTLQVEDDGIGFQPPTEVSPGHYGLANIQARVEQLGATYQLESKLGQGTRLSLSFKLNKP